MANDQDWVRDVLAFHEKFSQKISDTPRVYPINHPVTRLRLGLIDEERRELSDAIKLCDVDGVADAPADLAWVVIGTGVSYGMDLRPVWDEVRRANMAKDGGGTRADGKILKPFGWVPPDIASALKKGSLR